MWTPVASSNAAAAASDRVATSPVASNSAASAASDVASPMASSSAAAAANDSVAVSYTHLTLPTILLV